MSLSRLLTSLNNSLDSKLQRAVIHQASSLEWRHSELEPTCDARHLAATVCIAKGLRAVLVSRSLLFFAWLAEILALPDIALLVHMCRGGNFCIVQKSENIRKIQADLGGVLAASPKYDHCAQTAYFAFR